VNLMTRLEGQQTLLPVPSLIDAHTPPPAQAVPSFSTVQAASGSQPSAPQVSHGPQHLPLQHRFGQARPSQTCAFQTQRPSTQLSSLRQQLSPAGLLVRLAHILSG
jgi:hypothetical protein